MLSSYIDIIIFAAIAIFIAFKLHNMLGRKDFNHDKKSMKPLKPGNVISFPDKNPPMEENLQEFSQTQEKKLEALLPQEVKDTIKHIKTIQKNFSLESFIEGAKCAFEWTLDAYNQGKLDDLKPLTNQEVFTLFSEQISANQANEEIHENTLVAINSVDITGATLDGAIATLTLKFETEQINIVRNKAGEIISGDPSTIEKHEDTWVFERNLKSRDPNWTLINIST